MAEINKYFKEFPEFEKFTKKMEDIFGIKTPNVNIKEVKTRDEFNSKTGVTHSEKWICARATHDRIIIFSKDKFKKETGHNEESWLNVLKHEMVHMFYNKANQGTLPIWLNEGLACVLSGQNFKETKFTIKDILILNTREGFMYDKNAYSKAYTMVKKLLKEEV